MSPPQRSLFARAYAAGTDAEALAGEIARHLAVHGYVARADSAAVAAEIAPALAVHGTLVHADGANAARAAACHGLGEIVDEPSYARA